MKHLKLYENFKEDVTNIRNQYHALEIKIEDMRSNFISEIQSIFKIYAEKGKTLKINSDYIDELYKSISASSGIAVRFHLNRSFIDLYETDISRLAEILDKLKETYPEYFEGKGMGFFDLKTK